MPLNGKNIKEILCEKEDKIIEEIYIEIAGNMIQEGLPTSQISRITGLDVNSIHQLKLGK